MRNINLILVLGLLLLNTSVIYSSSIFYPYVIRLDYNIKIKSIAYRTYDSPEPGKSWIYKNNRLLYTIDKHLTGYLLTDKTGEILIEINFKFPNLGYNGYLKNENGDSVYINGFKEDAIFFYKHGELVKSFNFKDLNFDSKMLESNYNQYYWRSNNKQIKTPALIENESLCILCIDDEELRISLTDFLIYKKKISDDRLDNFINHREKRKINIKKHGLPNKFILPLLITNKTIERKLANYLGYKLINNERDTARLQIYIHTLLIDREGKCTQCYVTPILKTTAKIDFGNEPDEALKKKIEDWLLCQKYQTKLIPRYSDKYGFSDFLYMK